MKKWCLKIFGTLLIGSILLGVFAGCSGKTGRAKRFGEWMEPNGKVKVLSTIAQIGDLVEEIGGDRIDGWVLIHGDLDPHSYELVKGDDEKFSRADLVIYNGLGLEHGASISSNLENHPKSLSIGEEIQKASPQKILHKKRSVDPHIWMDISLWKEAVDPIADRLSQIDPAGQEIYYQRADQLKNKMDEAHRELFATLHRIPPEKRYLVTSHDAFHYFTKSYLADPSDGDTWMERFAAPEGLAPDGQLNPNDIAEIISFLKKKKITVLFPESNVSRDSIKKIVSAGREMGLEISICSEVLYGDAMGKGGYLDMMKHNGEVISRYLEENR